MALTETTQYDKIEVVGEFKNIQVRKADVIKKDGNEIARSYFRYALAPGLLDGNDELKQFVKVLEKVCINTVEEGFMTKDLAILINKNQKYLTTDQFLEKINYNLKKNLN